jgi:RNA 2',3'-cyclic 3'-phosphodiesterase
LKRTFIAIPVPPADDRLLSFLVRCRNIFPSSGIRWVDPSILHLTLAFLGDTQEGDVPRVMEVLQQMAVSHPPFQFTLSGAGFFGSHSRPSVLWAGVSSGPEMQAIRAKIVKELKAFGIQTDLKPFFPHITIGRIRDFKPGTSVDAFMNSYKGIELQETDVREIIYYESLLTQGGPIYNAMGRFQLSGY